MLDQLIISIALQWYLSDSVSGNASIFKLSLKFSLFVAHLTEKAALKRFKNMFYIFEIVEIGILKWRTCF